MIKNSLRGRRILLADDDPVARRVAAAALRALDYHVEEVEDGWGALDALSRDDAPLLAVLDWEMPGYSGPEVCERVRAWQAPRYPYLILLTGRTQPEDVVRGIEAGADDFMRKPFNFGELRARLYAGERLLRMQDRLLVAQDELRNQAMHDSLTGLFNRGAVIERLDAELHRGDRDGTPVSIALIDIDHFKRVNDDHGHLAGDAALREVSCRLTCALRPYDVLGRYGGEELLVVLPGCESTGARTAAERMRGIVSAEPVACGAAAIAVHVSIGVSTWRGGPIVSDALIAAADAALYRAKAAGRDRVESAVEVPAGPVVPQLSRAERRGLPTDA